MEGVWASCCGGGAGFASDGEFTGAGFAGFCSAAAPFGGDEDPLACAAASDPFADATTANHSRSVAVRIVEYRFSKQCPWARALLTSILTSMECARLMLYELFRPRFPIGHGLGKPPAQSPGTNIDQQRRAILAGKPATYNKGFARKDFAV